MLKGRELEDEFCEICRTLGGDVESRAAGDDYLAGTKALYHGGPVSWAMSPKIYSAADVGLVRDAAETMGTIMDKVTRRFLDDASFRASFALSPEMERLCLVEAGYERLIPIARVDIFLDEDTGGYQFCELNTDGSAGMTTTVEVTRAIQRTATYAEFSRRHPGVRTFDVTGMAVDAVLATYGSWEGAGKNGRPSVEPAVAFVDYDESASHDEVDDLCAIFRARGCEARFADIRDLRLDGSGRLCDGVGPIDCVWRRAVTSEMLEKPCPGADALVEAARSGAACVVGSFRTWPCATKTIFAVLWGDAAKETLSPDEVEFVHAHVPYTEILTPQTDLARFSEKDRWIAKPAGGYNAVGVVAGLDATDDGWAGTLAELAAHGGVVQAYARQYATPCIVGGRLPDGADPLDFAPANNMEGLYLFDGRFAGVFTRCGYAATIGEWTGRLNMGCLVVDE